MGRLPAGFWPSPGFTPAGSAPFCFCFVPCCSLWGCLQTAWSGPCLVPVSPLLLYRLTRTSRTPTHVQITDLEEWLNGKEEAQAKKADHEDPAFTVNEVGPSCMSMSARLPVWCDSSYSAVGLTLRTVCM